MLATVLVLGALSQVPPSFDISVNYPGPPAPVYLQIYDGEWRDRGLLPNVAIRHVQSGGRTTSTVMFPGATWLDLTTKRTPPSAYFFFMVNGVKTDRKLTAGDSYNYP